MWATLRLEPLTSVLELERCWLWSLRRSSFRSGAPVQWFGRWGDAPLRYDASRLRSAPRRPSAQTTVPPPLRSRPNVSGPKPNRSSSKPNVSGSKLRSPNPTAL